jgi:hypothetical protein
VLQPKLSLAEVAITDQRTIIHAQPGVRSTLRIRRLARISSSDRRRVPGAVGGAEELDFNGCPVSESTASWWKDTESTHIYKLDVSFAQESLKYCTFLQPVSFC